MSIPTESVSTRQLYTGIVSMKEGKDRTKAVDVAAARTKERMKVAVQTLLQTYSITITPEEQVAYKKVNKFRIDDKRLQLLFELVKVISLFGIELFELLGDDPTNWKVNAEYLKNNPKYREKIELLESQSKTLSSFFSMIKGVTDSRIYLLKLFCELIGELPTVDENFNPTQEAMNKNPMVKIKGDNHFTGVWAQAMIKREGKFNAGVIKLSLLSTEYFTFSKSHKEGRVKYECCDMQRYSDYVYSCFDHFPEIEAFYNRYIPPLISLEQIFVLHSLIMSISRRVDINPVLTDAFNKLDLHIPKELLGSIIDYYNSYEPIYIGERDTNDIEPYFPEKIAPWIRSLNPVANDSGNMTMVVAKASDPA